MALVTHTMGNDPVGTKDASMLIIDASTVPAFRLNYETQSPKLLKEIKLANFLTI